VRRMCGEARPPEVRPDQFVGTKAPRTGGSLVLAAWAICRALYCDLSSIGVGENPPILPVVSVRKLNARAIVGHVGRVMKLPHNAHNVIGKITKDEVVIRHAATGTPIAIRVIAGSRAASNLESFWHVSVAFDEVFKLQGEADSMINLDDARTAVRGRIIPGGQISYVGSPWVPAGPAYELLEEYWGAPSKECVVVRATGPMMHPKHWTPERLKQLSESKDRRDRDTAVLGMGEFLSKTTGLVTESDVLAVTARAQRELPCQFGTYYVAAMDPAIRRNAWSLVIGHRRNTRLVVDFCKQWVPVSGEKLRAKAVLREVAAILKRYGLDKVFSDQWSSDTLSELAEDQCLKLIDHQQRGAKTQKVLRNVVDGVIHGAYDLPPDPDLRRDLLQIKQRVGQAGPQIYLAATPDGRHADYIPALALVDDLLPEDTPGYLEDRFPAGFLEYGPPKVEAYPEEYQGVLRPAPIEVWSYPM